LLTGNANSYISVVTTQADGKILVGGSFTIYNGASVTNITRLNPDGTLDPGFLASTAGYGQVAAIHVRADGKIFIGGSGFIYLLNTDGSRDMSFNPGIGFDGLILALVVQPDGKVVAGGRFRFYQNTYLASHIIRLNTDASIDAGFVTGSGFNGDVYSIAQQDDGKLLVGGLFANFNGTSTFVRLNSGGSLDGSFNPSGAGTITNVRTIVPQPDGKWLLGGDFPAYNGVTRNYMARINADGTLDNAFDPVGNFNAPIASIVLQPDGKILVGGNFYNYNGLTRSNVARLNTDGSLDPGFAVNAGSGGPVSSIRLQPDGKLKLGGLFTYCNQRVKKRPANAYGYAWYARKTTNGPATERQ